MNFETLARQLIEIHGNATTGSSDPVFLEHYQGTLVELFRALLEETSSGLGAGGTELRPVQGEDWRSKIRRLETAISLNLSAGRHGASHVKKFEEKLRIAKRRVAEFDRLGHGMPPVPQGTLPWRLLPAGDWPKLQAELRWRIPPIPGEPYEDFRIEHAYSLEPLRTWSGREEFERYIAFEYGPGSGVLLESPDQGNAAYIFKENWEAFSRRTKFQLAHDTTGLVTRVIHRGGTDWRSRIHLAVKYPGLL